MKRNGIGSVSRKAWAGILVAVLLAGVAAAVVYSSNFLRETSNVSGSALTIAFSVNHARPGTFQFVNTAYEFALLGCSNTGAALAGSYVLRVSRVGIAPTDLALRSGTTTLGPVQDGNTLIYTHPGQTYNICPFNTNNFVAYQAAFATDGAYAWEIQAQAAA